MAVHLMLEGITISEEDITVAQGQLLQASS
jgi:hypothetical protein